MFFKSRVIFKRSSAPDLKGVARLDESHAVAESGQTERLIALKKPTRIDLEAALRSAAAGKSPVPAKRPAVPRDEGVTLEKLAMAFSKAKTKKPLQ